MAKKKKKNTHTETSNQSLNIQYMVQKERHTEFIDAGKTFNLINERYEITKPVVGQTYAIGWCHAAQTDSDLIKITTIIFISREELVKQIKLHAIKKNSHTEKGQCLTSNQLILHKNWFW